MSFAQQYKLGKWMREEKTKGYGKSVKTGRLYRNGKYKYSRAISPSAPETANPYQDVVDAVVAGGYDLIVAPIRIRVILELDGTETLQIVEETKALSDAITMFEDLWARGRLTRLRGPINSLMTMRETAIEQVKADWEAAGCCSDAEEEVCAYADDAPTSACS